MALGKGRASPGALGLIALLVAATLPMHAHAALNLDGSGDEVAHTPSSGSTKLTISSTQGHILDVGGTTVATVTSSGTTFTGTTTMGAVSTSGTITLSAASQSLTHSGSGTLAVSSSGDITIAAGSNAADYVKIEDVQISGLTIGTATNTNLLTLADTKLTVDSEFELSADAAEITHSAAAGLSNGGLTIKSTNGFVDVESVRFTGADIGISGTTDIMELTVDGSSVSTVAVKHKLTTGGLATLNSATVTNALTASAAVTVGTTLGVTGATTLTGTALMKESVTLDKAAATITHTDATTAAGSLTISSTTGNVAISAKTGSTVDVESIRFKDAQIGLSNDDDMVTLTSTGSASTVAFADKVTTGGIVAIAGTHSDTSKELYVNGDVYATGTVTSASDARFKRDVRPVSGAMAIARALNPVTFDFKVDTFPDRRFPTERQAGVIAQELEETLPNLVTTDDLGYKGVAYERLGVYAMAAVKELDADADAEFETQRRKIASHAATLAAMEKRLAEMDEAIRSLSQAVVEVAK
uniref:Peptidase S74 domain-containing protein n=1 Tax=Micromonas pusilla TaxID=38833 RepID=A0A7S0NKF7_MICPS|mmetsp:Transcript_2815/g.11497  ORF Transcript_2815/g.11497 Transcript_2815/m.11497 type:complete len:529 (+) Transcript_2815:199-1785(+)